ncbi:MAG: hypothetical protein ACREA9_18370, partial [Pyrinomonadaceae bacterium]
MAEGGNYLRAGEDYQAQKSQRAYEEAQRQVGLKSMPTDQEIARAHDIEGIKQQLDQSIGEFTLSQRPQEEALARGETEKKIALQPGEKTLALGEQQNQIGLQPGSTKLAQAQQKSQIELQ